MISSTENIKTQKLVTVVALFLFIIKLYAWYLTNSVAILTDALESTINVISAFVGLYSLYLSARPKDTNHPYGHGKVEFVSAAIEGTLISVAGLIIIYEAINNLKHPHTVGSLDIGMVLICFSGIINYVAGTFAIRNGKKNNSLALAASGKHLISDSYSTIGILIGLVILSLTKLVWIDSALALIFALIIIFTGYKIVRQSLAGIMDEADYELLDKFVLLLNKNRNDNWIDLHNLRIIKYGSILHLDCHLTVPWYFNVNEAHFEVDKLEKLVKENFGESVELFVHIDGCLQFSCKLCNLKDCAVRQSEFIKRIEWNRENISSNRKHRL